LEEKIDKKLRHKTLLIDEMRIFGSFSVRGCADDR
jgi:hypothetical protein